MRCSVAVLGCRVRSVILTALDEGLADDSDCVNVTCNWSKLSVRKCLVASESHLHISSNTL